MHRTLLFIPHEIAGLPVLGFGWMLIFAGIAFAVRLGWAHLRRQSIAGVLATEGLMWGMVVVGILFILPMVELKNVDDQPVGMAIRGYGVMLLAGVGSAIALAAYRAKRRGMDPDVILSMAPWAFVGGIVGARLFYVIQYRDKFIADSVAQTLRNMFAFTEGGLVVYGSFIGGFIALAFFIVRHRLPLLKLGDVIVPCLFIGVFFGRIGCLMNGCCYGGRCDDGWTAMYFPPNTQVYHDQLGSGELLGLSIDPVSRRIEQVADGSPAAVAGITAGSVVNEIASDRSPLSDAPQDVAREDVLLGVMATVDGKRYRWLPDELPPRALAVQPAQLISSVSSMVLCVALCWLPVFRIRDGTVMMLGFAGYAVLRFVLELIRVDELGQFGTSLSISQWVSIVVFSLSAAGLVWLYTKPDGRSLQPQPSAET